MVKIRHVAIKVNNLEKSLAFYRDALSLSYVRTRDYETFQALDLTDGETNLTLLVSKGKSTPVRKLDGAVGLDHIGFLVDEIDSTYERLKKAGAEFLPQTQTDFFKVLDPNGIVIDIASTRRGW